ncbi:MAG: holo-ACP synthase [Chloroflexi bacterium]|nr:holo-ACP synthase [Chloroflexota bacterium]
MLSVGVDIMEVSRIRSALERWGDRFLRRVYTPGEIERYRGRVPELAVRFAGKEAVMKVLGTGNRGVSWREIEILPLRSGKPTVRLYHRAKAHAQKLGLGEVAISLSHSREYAVASAAGMLEEEQV